MKGYKKVGLVLTLLFSLFGMAKEVSAAEGDSISPVNLITTKGEAVQLPDDVFYSSSTNQNYGQREVVWNAIDSSIFSQVGKHEISGKTVDGENVKGYIHVFDGEKAVNISVLGDSITASNWNGLIPYPAQMNNRLGDKYKVTNFGYSGASLSQYAELPYKNTERYATSKKTAFDALVIQLGTNDSWNRNWINRNVQSTFKTEYVAMVKEYQKMNSEGIVYVCLPPAMTTVGQVASVRKEILRAVKELGGNITVIDNHTVSKAEAVQTGYYSDGLHPNSKGLATLSNNIYENLHGLSVPTLSDAFSVQAFNKSSQIVSRIEADTKDFYLDQISDKDWVSFKNVDFTNNAGYISLTTAINGNVGTGNVQAEIHLDSIDGPIVGQGILRRETAWQDSVFKNTEVSGTHDIYIKFIHPSNDKFTPLIKVKTVNVAYEDESQNLLKNGDFEAGLNYWIGENEYSYGVDANKGYQGKKLWFYKNGLLKRSVHQTVTDLEDGIYTISAMAWNTSVAGSGMKMELTLADGTSTVVPISRNSTYQKIEGVVEVKGGQLDIKFDADSQNVNGAINLAVDNVELTKGGTLPEKNYLKNGDFELGMASWSASGSGSAGVDSNDAYQGQKLWLYSGSTFDKTVQQTVTGLEDGVYTLTAMVKRNTATGGTGRIELTTSGEDPVVKPIAVNNKYEEVSQTVEVKNGELKVAFRYKGGAGNLQVDNVTLIKGGTLPEKNYLKNGDFELDSKYWEITGNGNSGVDSSDAYQGQKLWLYSGATYDRTVSQTVTGLEDGVYTLTAMVKRNTYISGTARIELTTAGEDPVIKPIALNNKYEQVSQTVEVKNGQLKVAFRYKGGAGNLQVDSVSLTKGGTLPEKNYLRNGDFEQDKAYWEADGTNSYGVDINDAYAGQKLYIYSSYAFNRTVSQKITDLENGVYTVQAMVKKTGNMTQSLMELTTGGNMKVVQIPVSNNYVQISYQVEVTDGNLTVSFHGQGPGYQGFQVDNVTVTKEGNLSESEPLALTVGTFNIASYQKPNVNSLRALVETKQTDIVGLQEVERNSSINNYDMLKSFGSSVYPHTYFSKAIDMLPGEYGNGLASKYTIVDTQTIKAYLPANADTGARVIQRVVLDIEGKQVAVYNTHFSEGAKNVTIRKGQIQQLRDLALADKCEYVILLGDFNADQTHSEFDLLSEHFNMANGKDGVYYDTFNGKGTTMKVYAIDNIFTSKNIEIETVGMEKTALSDHNFLYATITLR